MRHKSSKSTGLLFDAGEMSETSRPRQRKTGQSTSSVADSHARTSAQPAAPGAGSLVDEQTCSSRPFASLVCSDRDGSYWRTCRPSGLFERDQGGQPDQQWDEWSAPWPRSGMWERGTAFPRPTLAPSNYGIAFILWPTLSTSGYASQGQGKKVSEAAASYEEAVQMTDGRRSIVDKWFPAEERTDRKLTGRLSPEWAEWLMGFPAGWTELEDSGTQ